MDTLIDALQKLINENNADLVKIYFESDKAYSIKVIKGEEIIKRIKRGKQTHLDLKPSLSQER